MKRILILSSLIFTHSLSAEVYKSNVDNWKQPDGSSWISWDLQGGSDADRAAIKTYIDTFIARWVELTSYAPPSNGPEKFAACIDRNARVNIAYVSKGSPFTGTTMIGQINWHVMRYQLFPQAHTIKVDLRDGECSGGVDWIGCASVDTWPIVDYGPTYEIPGWSDSPRFNIALRRAYIQSSSYKLGWASTILHELLHNFGWRHSSYNGNVQMVAMQKCFVDTNFTY